MVKGGMVDPLEPISEGTDETKLEPIETLELLEDGWTLLKMQMAIRSLPRDGCFGIAHDGPSYKLSCAWATAAKKRVKNAP